MSSSATTIRPRIALLLLATLGFTLLVAVGIASSKEVVNFFGTAAGSGSRGGEFNVPQDSAVNTTGNGPAGEGDIYVVDGNNHRIQRFDRDGGFISAWGADVAAPAGGADYEICVVADDCLAGKPSGGNGARAGNGTFNAPQSVAVDSDTGYVYVSDRNNRRINVYDGVGGFLFSVGRDVAEPDGGTAVEICDGATDVCRAGDNGSGPGEFTSSGVTGFGIAVSPADENPATGAVFLANSGRGIETYDLDGRNPSSVPSGGAFSTGQPTRVAVDSQGIVYASDGGNGGEIERYDSAGVHGPVGFIESIGATVNEVQRLSFTNFAGAFGPSPGDSFTLTCPNDTPTDVIEYEGGAQLANRIRNALEDRCGAGRFAVTGGGVGGITVTYQAAFGGMNIATMVCTPVAGAGNEVCGVSSETDGASDALLPASGLDANSATSGIAVDPDTDALFVLRDPSIGNTVVQQFNEPGSVAAPSADNGRHAGGAGFSAVGGLGIDSLGDRLFISASTDVGPFTGSPHRVYVVDEPLPVSPEPVVSPIITKGEDDATFTGTVDPRGGVGVSCAFQYSTDQVRWVDLPEPGCLSLDPNGGAQEVSESVSGLDPNTRYFVRLAVTRFFESEPTLSVEQDFMTDSVPPGVADIGAIQVSNTSARLVGTINPKNSDTSYVLEYGTTPALDESTEPLAVGGGTDPITVSQVIDGLSPDTAYFFKVAATNDFGTTRSDSGTFHTRVLPSPNPSNRGWEQVTPVDKNYISANVIPGFEPIQAGVSIDGERVGFCTSAVFGDPPGQQVSKCAPYLSVRNGDAERWDTTNPFPRVCHTEQFSGRSYGVQTPYLNPDYTRAVLHRSETDGCPTIPPLSPLAPLNPFGDEMAVNIYLSDMTRDPHSYHLVNRRVINFTGRLNDTTLDMISGIQFEGGSDDFDRIVFLSFVNQTDPPDSPAPGNYSKLYLWERQGAGDCVEPDGCLELLSVDPNGDPIAEGAVLPKMSGIAGNEIHLPNAVSSNGERIYFQTPILALGESTARMGTAGCDFDCRVYMREGGAETFHVSESECTVDCGAPLSKGKEFINATSDGGKAFFVSCAKLTNESSPEGNCDAPAAFGGYPVGVKLYRWDRGAAPGAQLVDLSIDSEVADGAQPNFRGLVGISDQGDIAYFVADGQLVEGESTDPGDKLYRWRWNDGEPEVDFIAPYLGPARSNLVSDYNVKQQHHQVSADGRYVLIYTALPYDRAADRDSDVDIYRWGEGGGWTCVSCQLPGVPSTGDVDLSEVWLGFSEVHLPVLGSSEPRIHMSEDGQRVFFGTTDALVPEDTNGEVSCPSVITLLNRLRIHACQDVYEWHDGTVSLLSSGTGTTPARLIGSTPSGRDVFFYSGEKLVGWDRDNVTDIYNARIDGGFPEPPAQPPACEGEACRGPGTTASSLPGAATREIVHGGNTRPAPNACRRFNKQAKRKLAAAKRAGKKRQVKRAKALRRQARNLNRRAARCNRRQAS